MTRPAAGLRPALASLALGGNCTDSAAFGRLSPVPTGRTGSFVAWPVGLSANPGARTGSTWCLRRFADKAGPLAGDELVHRPPVAGSSR